jgi:hypothetical protein
LFLIQLFFKTTCKFKVVFTDNARGRGLPLLIEAIIWSVKYQPVDEPKYIPAIELAKGGPEVIASFRARLLKGHGLRA